MYKLHEHKRPAHWSSHARCPLTEVGSMIEGVSETTVSSEVHGCPTNFQIDGNSAASCLTMMRETGVFSILFHISTLHQLYRHVFSSQGLLHMNANISFLRSLQLGERHRHLAREDLQVVYWLVPPQARHCEQH